MATKEEFLQLKKTVQELRKSQLDILIKLEGLEDRVASLEGGEGGGARKSKEPEAILTCVQCNADYKESENAEGSCKYHGGKLAGVAWEFKYSCCDKSAPNYEDAKTLAGCTKGKHRSKHHMDYPYAAYIFYMHGLSRKAKEIWMELDIQDYVTERAEWAEVGLTEDGENVFVVMGSSPVDVTACAVFTREDLRNCESPCFTALEKADSVGWSFKVEVFSANSVASAISVSIKPASSTTPLVKRVGLSFVEDVPKPGKVECISEPTSPKASVPITVPEGASEGPVLEAGVDYSKDRKNDYETETSNGCPLTLQQYGHTEVESTNRKFRGRWSNLFIAKVKVTNTLQENLAITDVYGEFMNQDGEWVRCDNQWIGSDHIYGNYSWFESTNVSLDPASTGTLVIRVALAFCDNPPSTNQEGRRAHPSLPQPLHFRVTFVDQEKRTASLRFEQGNRSLDIATRESREKSWCRGRPLEFHLFADDVDKKKRSDVALYYDDNGALCYRPAPNNNASQYFFIMSSIGKAAYKAQQAKEAEYELTDYKKENGESSVRIFLVSDLELGVAYALRVLITTPTSSASGYYLLPTEDPSTATLTVDPQEVSVKGEVTVAWTVPRASKKDRIAIFPLLGKSYTDFVTNKEGTESGSLKLPVTKATPGQYEVRYCPAWLDSSHTPYRHTLYWAPTPLTVTQP